MRITPMEISVKPSKYNFIPPLTRPIVIRRTMNTIMVKTMTSINIIFDISLLVPNTIGNG
ncbi:MAG: hypothetical protein QXV11_06930 [Desulfurococcaceae archaeon]